MKQNLGNADRIVRVIIAAILIFLFASGTVTGALGIVLLVAGLVFMGTSAVGICPLYLPFKFSTKK